VKRVCVAIDDWKLSIFERRFREAGFTWEQGDGLCEHVIHLYVETDDVEGLGSVVGAAQVECAIGKGRSPS
jgi:hypothetical protein